MEITDNWDSFQSMQIGQSPIVSCSLPQNLVFLAVIQLTIMKPFNHDDKVLIVILYELFFTFAKIKKVLIKIQNHSQGHKINYTCIRFFDFCIQNKYYIENNSLQKQYPFSEEYEYKKDIKKEQKNEDRNSID